MNSTSHTGTPSIPAWRVHAANLDAPVRQRQGELLLDQGRAVHESPNGTGTPATTGSVTLADLVSIVVTITAGTSGPDVERQVVELSTEHERLRLAAPAELVLAALRSVHVPSLVRALAASPAGAR